MTNNRDDAREIFRNAVLIALDTAAWEVFGDSIHENTAGARDEDLPHLVPCINEQVERLSQRFNHPLLDENEAA